MMLHCRKFLQFIFVMTVIDSANICRRILAAKWLCSHHLLWSVQPGTGAPRFPFMVTVVKHRKVNIVVLAPDEPIAAHCAPGDIAIVAAADGWWNHFIGSDGAIDSYDRPYHSYNEALWAAKAAAEFGFS
jgi:hypothetical protein